MLGNLNVCAVLAVKDLQKAKEFYEGKLELKAKDGEDPGGIFYVCGGNTGVFVYESQFAGTNQATAAAWSADNIEEVVADLKSKGVTFEQYDMPQVERQGDIHVMGKLKAAWFKDPDGNILNVTNM
jgi:catechol 2,3-dioxygenase-like lactoylglutathione lyase family enzyme